MISPFAIWTIARCEARLLWRSWAFRLFSALGLFILFFLNLALGAQFSNAPHFFRSLSGSLPLANIKLLNLYQGLIAAFLATEFVKRDRRQDTIQTVFVRSFTNLDYVLGKVLGMLAVFAGLQLVVLVPVAVVHRFFAPVFAWQPYVLFTVFATLPTLLFAIGISSVLIFLLRVQALVLVLVVGLSLLSLIVGFRFFHIFDIFVFHLPLTYSDFVGLGNLRQLLLVRGAHLLVGGAGIAAASLFNPRLRQSRLATVTALFLTLGCATGAAWAGATYLEEQQETNPYRQQLRALGRSVGDQPSPTLANCRIELEHTGHSLAVKAELAVVNAHDFPLDSLLFTLNPGLRVNEIATPSGPLRRRREEHLLWIFPESPLAPGDTCRFDLVYAGKLDPRYCYLDIEDERFGGGYRMWIYSLPKAYALVTADFLHLTPESAWYPTPGLPPGPGFPTTSQRAYARYGLTVAVPRGWTAFSQGSASIDTAVNGLTYRFQPEQPLPQISLTAGPYERRELTVDEVTYTLAYLPGHDYYATYFDSVSAALPEVIRGLRNEYEVALGLAYPYPRLSLVEVPIQFYAYRRLWTVAQETVQPEIVFLPEMGTLCEGADFRRMKRRSTRSQEQANLAETAQQLQSDYLRTFARVELLGTQDPGSTDLSQNRSLEARWEILPNFLSYSTHISSGRWPVLNFAFESYFRERISPPQNTWSRQWTGLTDTERANLLLQEHSLVDLLSLPDSTLHEESSIRETGIRTKCRQLLVLLAASVGAEGFDRELVDLVAAHAHREIADQELVDLLVGLSDVDPEALIETWYRTPDLPGYRIDRADVFLVRDRERTRTQLEVDLANPTEVDGLVELNLRYRQSELVSWWDRQRSGWDAAHVVALPARTRKQVGFLLDQPVAELIVDTYVGRNIPSLIYYAYGEPKLRRHAVPFSGERVVPLESASADTVEYLVDNEDEGFEVLTDVRVNWLRRFLADLFHLDRRVFPYVGVRWWNPPSTWQATTDHRLYGRFVLSGYYKESGDGRTRVAWRTQVDTDGDYDVYFFCGLTEELERGGRRVKGQQAMNFLVYHEDGVEDLRIDLPEIERGWNYLGTYRLAAGPARVELTDLSQRRLVVADAVKWMKRRGLQ